MRGIFVYDIEVYKSCVLFGFINPETNKIKIFELSGRINNSRSLHKFLGTCNGLIGFNNLSYDNTIINYFLRTGVVNPQKYYELSQRIINGSATGETHIPQMDLFKINHWDNKARVLSLKMAEVRMNFHNVADLPYAYDAELSYEQINKLKKYLKNDLEATLAVYKLFPDKYYLRSVLKREYGLKCTNWSDSKIGEELLLKLYCEKTGEDPQRVKTLRTKRKEIKLDEIIFDYIEFKTPQLQQLLKKIRSKVITNTKGGFKEKFIYGDIETHLAQGGIHASRRGIFRSSDTHKIIDIDVGSLAQLKLDELLEI